MPSLISAEMRANDPRKANEGPGRPAIERGHGTTDSERYLAGLAEKSFLNLWSYPNLFFDKRVRGKGDGKELCDLLVVCGDHVLIFSDKDISWPSGETGIAWPRWYRRSIDHSVQQIRGAQRWISQFPDRLFIDRACTNRLPIPLPPVERRKVHGIVVARGATAACRTYFKGGSGSLMLVPQIVGKQHFEGASQPFAIGDVDPDGSFVHVFDEVSLEVVMRELDTVSDFTAYLAKKEQLIRGGKLISAAGEEELVAEYMIRMNEKGEHDFTKPDGSPIGQNEFITYASGSYARVVKNPQYIAKKNADQISYAWDRLITLFTEPMLQGTSIIPPDVSSDIATQEIAIREMALLTRFDRRNYGGAVVEALELGQKGDKFMRAVIAGPDHPCAEIGFFILTVKVPKLQLKGGYEQYRSVRINILETYAYTLLRKNPQLKRIIGIAAEPKRMGPDEEGSSEDLLYLERPAEWSDKLLRDLDERKEAFGIDQPGNMTAHAIRGNEFPEVLTADLHDTRGLNRKQRRAMKAKQRRSSKKSN